MRQIEEIMCNAVATRKRMSISNTLVSVEDGTINVYLHGNLIYTQKNGVKRFTLAGWNTSTTRSRLRALGVDVYQRNYVPMYNSKEISKSKWYTV